MRKRTFLAGLVSWAIATLGSSILPAAEGWPLITKEEYDRELEWSTTNKPPAAVSEPPVDGAPVIELLQPDQKKPIKSPVSIVVKLSAEPGAKIDPSSMRVLYGFLKLDITDKIRKYAKFDETGLHADKAELPPGTHHFTFSIADNKGRVASQSFVVTVV